MPEHTSKKKLSRGHFDKFTYFCHTHKNVTLWYYYIFFHFQICVPLPQRSLVIVQGQSRYEWQHSIHRKHIISRRLATTLRELTPDFMPGGKFYETTGRDILEAASNYQGSPVNFRT